MMPIPASISSKGNFPSEISLIFQELTLRCSVRYAAPPLGNLRFAAPQAPVRDRKIASALSDPPACPQTGASSQTPAAYGFTSAIGNEDCLFLNVYAPAHAKNLPVFFWVRESLSKQCTKCSGPS